LLGTGVVALLGLFVLARQRELRLLREQVAQALALEARQRPLLAAAAAAVTELAPAPAAGAVDAPTSSPPS